MICQRLATRTHPQALVLINSAAPADLLAIGAAVFLSFFPTFATPLFWRRPVRFSFGRARFAFLNRLPEATARAIHERSVAESGRAVFEVAMPWLDRGHATAVDARQVRCPVMVWAGEKDRATPAWLQRQIARKYQATLREVRGRGHMLIAEEGHEEVAHAIHQWLQAHSVRTT